MFDTLKYVKELEEAGISRPQAESYIRIVKEVTEMNLATKQDIKDLEKNLGHQIAIIDQKITITAQHLTIKLGLMLVGSTSLLFALLKLGA